MVDKIPFSKETRAALKHMEALDEERTEIWKAINEATAPALKAYQEAKASAREAFDEAVAQAWKVYDEAMTPAQRVYMEAVIQVLTSEKATAQARKAYREVKAQVKEEAEGRR